MGEQLDDDAVEHLLSGTRDSDDLGRLLGAIKAEFDAIDAAAPGPQLKAFLEGSPTGAASAPTDELSIARKRRRRIAVVAAAGTTLGKLMIGVSAAAASVAGMHATGLVDVPVLLDRGRPSESVVVDDTNLAPPTTRSTTTSTQPAVPADTRYRFDVADAGTVSIDVTNAEVVAASAKSAPGWMSRVSFTDAAVDISFNRFGDKVDVRAVLDGDLLHVVIRDHRSGTTEEFWLDSDGNPTLPDRAPPLRQQPGVTPAPGSADTVDDHTDDDDPTDNDESDDDPTESDDESDESDESDDDQPEADTIDDESDDDVSEDESDDDGAPDDASLDNDESD